MWRFVLLSFAFMSWGYYELSGGSDFKPMSELSTQELAALGREPLPPLETPQEAPVVLIAEAAPVAPAPEVVTSSANSPATLTLAVLDTTPDATVIEAAVEAALEVAPTPEPIINAVPEPVLDIRLVAGSRVNMRAGPGTNFSVLGTLSAGEPVEIIEVYADGWAQLRVVSTDQVGWMAARLLTDPTG